MRELQQKQKAKKRLYSLPVLGILALITIFIMHGAYVVMQKKQESAVYVEQLQTKVGALANRQAELKKETDRLQTDEGLDTEIKKKFSVSKQGEHVVVIVDPKTAPTTTSTTTKHWYDGIKGVFSNLW